MRPHFRRGGFHKPWVLQERPWLPVHLYGFTYDAISNLTNSTNFLKTFTYRPSLRVVFDAVNAASVYTASVTGFFPYAYIMGMLYDSTDMALATLANAQSRVTDYVSTLDSVVDIWEVGNELNGGWLATDASIPSNTMQKVVAMYDGVIAGSAKAKPLTAITFFYEGETGDTNNCIDTTNNGNAMFAWINTQFQLSLAPGSRDAGNERLRKGVDYVLVSWYPDGCSSPGAQATFNAASIFSQLQGIFPQARVGFGELGTANPASQSLAYNKTQVDGYYPLHKSVVMPGGYCVGGWWWYAHQQLVTGGANNAAYGSLGDLIKTYANPDVPEYWLPQ